jgi:hypothetical protein
LSRAARITNAEIIFLPCASLSSHSSHRRSYINVKVVTHVPLGSTT